MLTSSPCVLTGEEAMERGDDLEAADSGMGTSLRPSSGRLSSLSHFSDERISSLSHVSEGTVINIPDGRYVLVSHQHTCIRRDEYSTQKNNKKYKNAPASFPPPLLHDL